MFSTAAPSGREHFDWDWKVAFIGMGLSWLKKPSNNGGGGSLNPGSALGQDKKP